MSTIVLQTCPRCGGSMEGHHRGTMANMIGLHNTNIVICVKPSCRYSIDMEEIKKKMWCP